MPSVRRVSPLSRREADDFGTEVCLLMNKHLSHGDRHKTVSCDGWRWMGQVALRDDYWVPRGPFCPQEVCRANMMNLEVGQVCR